MAVQYWVGDFFVDLSRNQITHNKQSRTMAPKALAVLTCLAENQGKVVSQDALLDKIWHDTVVSPNTLQRSIAQLRKALGDDGKGQSCIKTHSKQGYSLECDVRWPDNAGSTSSNSSQENLVIGHPVIEDQSDIDILHKPSPSRPGLKLFSIAAGIMILSIIGYQGLVPALSSVQTSSLTFDNLRSLTATDDKEFDATYTPDGQYVVFHRYLDKTCVNKLWAKNTSTQEEVQLTEDWGAYGSHSFSEDGKTLVFLATEPCSEPVTQKICYDLMSLDFEQALESPQQPGVMLQCRNSDVKNPTWLGNDNIALLQSTSDHWKLIDYSVSRNESTDLYDPSDGNLIDFAYSASDDLIAVISVHDDERNYIEMIKPDGRVISSHQIAYPPEISKFRPLYPSFDPLNKQLVFSTGRQLFTLSYDGQVEKISIPFADTMKGPEFHPDGKRLLMIKGPYDSDIALLPRNQITETNLLLGSLQTQLHQRRIYPIFERSTLGEDYAVFQPGGDLIAFWSERSGEEQVWVSAGNGPQQLTHFPMDTSIRGIDWAEDGGSLLVNANSVLTRVYLDSTQETFPLEHPVLRLFQWDSANNSALLQVSINGMAKLVEYDLNSSEMRELSDKRIIWALKGEDGRLIYKDIMDRFWQPGPVEAQHITSLDNQGNRSKSFVMKDNVIYAINTEDQLWSYDLDNDAFEILGEVDKDVDRLTDINQTQLLMTVQVSAKQEVVELSSSE